MDDLVRAAGPAADSVVVVVQREADTVGASSDDVARSWSDRVAASRERYEVVPAEVRSLGCDAAADLLSAVADGDPMTVAWAVESGVEAVGSLNRTVGARALADDLEAEMRKASDGDSDGLGLVLITAATCEAAG
jgi:hypothetical protein